jgi:hypothetical protein
MKWTPPPALMNGCIDTILAHCDADPMDGGVHLITHDFFQLGVLSFQRDKGQAGIRRVGKTKIGVGLRKPGNKPLRLSAVLTSTGTASIMTV